MLDIKLHLLFAGSKGEKNLCTLFDNGANLSCINPDCIEDLQQPVRLGRTRHLSTKEEGHYIEIREAICLDFYLNDVLLSDEFLIVPNLSEEVIIGAATLRKWRIKLNFETGKVEVNPRVAQLQLI